MQAVISGDAGLALLIEGEQFKLCRASAPDEWLPVSRAAYPACFGGASDRQFLEDCRQVDLTGLLTRVTRAARAFRYALYVLDPTLTLDLRIRVAGTLESMAKSFGYLRNRFAQAPLPTKPDLHFIDRDALPETHAFFQKLYRRQGGITRVARTMAAIPDEVFRAKNKAGSREDLLEILGQGGYLWAMAGGTQVTEVIAALSKTKLAEEYDLASFAAHVQEIKQLFPRELLLINTRQEKVGAHWTKVMRSIVRTLERGGADYLTRPELNHPVTDLLERVRAGSITGKAIVDITWSTFKRDMVHVLQEEGYIQDLEVVSVRGQEVIRIHLEYGADGKPAINGLKKLSGTRQNRARKSGVTVMKTDRGVMVSHKAESMGLAGTPLFEIW